MLIRNCLPHRQLLAFVAWLACVASPAKATGAWTRLPNLPTARLAAGAVALDGKLYVIGGCVVRDGAVHPIAAVEVFSPATGTWATKAPLPTPRSNFGVAIVDGRIFVIGGTITDNRSQTDVVDTYDPAMDTWSACAPLPTARSQVGAAAIGGRIYAIGGNAGHEHAFEVYDPATDRWALLPPLKNPRRDAGVVALGGRLYVAGGVGSDRWKPSGALEVYDPAVAQWTECESAQIGRSDFAFVELGSTLFALGGWNHGPIASVERYDPASGVWNPADDLPVATQFHCAAVLNGKIYMAGGTTKLPTATNAVYVWEPALPLGGPTSSSAVRKRSETHPSAATSSHADESVAASDAPTGSREVIARTETLTRTATKLTQTSEIARTSELPGFAVAMVTANGAACAYSNIGAALAGLALEGNAGHSFAGRSREIVFARWLSTIPRGRSARRIPHDGWQPESFCR